MNDAVDPILLHDWLAARSIARGLPAPVAEHGGFRVDTRSADEVCRWVFAGIAPGLVRLAQRICEPGYPLKACGTAEALRAVLPPAWRVQPPGYLMRAARAWDDRPLPAGYTIVVERLGDVTQVRVRARDAMLAASGYAAQTGRAFVYDRIVTAPAHRRRGLGAAVMTALRRVRRDAGLPELLVATEDGRALYRTLGWETLSTYVTGVVDGDRHGPP